MGTSANPIGRVAIFVALGITALMIVYYAAFGGDGRVAFGISMIVAITAAFIYLIYARMNTVQRTGTMSLLFMVLVAIMLPFFFLAQNKVNSDRTVSQYNAQLVYAASKYTTYCATCHGLLGQGIAAPQLNNGLTQLPDGNKTLDQFTATDINRIITAGIVDPTKPTVYLMPQWGQDYGGPLNADDVNALTALITSSSSTLRKKAGSPTSLNGFDFVPQFLVADPKLPNSVQNYQLQLAALSAPQGTPADLTAMTSVTIQVQDTPTNPASAYGFLYVDPKTGVTNNLIKIKVGTTVTWNNKSSALHSVTSGSNATGDANVWKSDDALAVGSTFTVTFNKALTTYYYCKYHNGMVGEIVVVP